MCYYTKVFKRIYIPIANSANIIYNLIQFLKFKAFNIRLYFNFNSKLYDFQGRDVFV